jgi:hypothetical protein
VLASPLIAQIWRAHRADGFAWASFLAAVADAGCDPAALTWRLSRHTVVGAPSYPKTRSRLRATFGSAPALWWPSRTLIAFAALARSLSEPLTLAVFWLALIGLRIWPEPGRAIFWLPMASLILSSLFSQVRTFWPQDFTVLSENRASLAGPTQP